MQSKIQSDIDCTTIYCILVRVYHTLSAFHKVQSGISAMHKIKMTIKKRSEWFNKAMIIVHVQETLQSSDL